MSLPALNGPKDARVLLALSLAKQPPRGPFARELRSQTGGNNASSVVERHVHEPDVRSTRILSPRRIVPPVPSLVNGHKANERWGTG